jgi:hypothetical protein
MLSSSSKASLALGQSSRSLLPQLRSPWDCQLICPTSLKARFDQPCRRPEGETSLNVAVLLALRRTVVAKTRRRRTVSVVLRRRGNAIVHAAVVRGRGAVAGHVHALLLGLVALGDGPAGGLGADLVVVLDEDAAGAAEAGAAVLAAVALDAVLFTNLCALEPGEDPAAARAGDEAEEGTARVALAEAVHCRVLEPVFSSAVEHAGTPAAQTARGARGAFAQAVFPFLRGDIEALGIALLGFLVGHDV